jgi:hypothetical protein
LGGFFLFEETYPQFYKEAEKKDQTDEKSNRFIRRTIRRSLPILFRCSDHFFTTGDAEEGIQFIEMATVSAFTLSSFNRFLTPC